MHIARYTASCAYTVYHWHTWVILCSQTRVSLKTKRNLAENERAIRNGDTKWRKGGLFRRHFCQTKWIYSFILLTFRRICSGFKGLISLDLDMRYGHSARTCRFKFQRHAALTWACSTNIQQGNEAKTCCMDIQVHSAC
jgi:hypothetical protein